MFELTSVKAEMWKKLVEAIKDLVTECNFQCSPAGIGIQAMDAAHVALVNLLLAGEGFQSFNCEQSCVLGISLGSLSKVLKTINNDDRLTMRHEEDSDVLIIVAEQPAKNKMSEYSLKLMEIESDTFGIPDLDYRTSVTFASAEFAKICRDMTIFGETVGVHVAEGGVKFSASSDFGDGFAFLKAGARAATKAVKRETKKEVKSEVKAEVKAEPQEDGAPPVKVKTEAGVAGEDEEEQDLGLAIQSDEPVNLSFALRYFTTFSKGSTLAQKVTLKLASETPCLIEFNLEGAGFLRYFLAPKVEDAAQ